MLDFLIMGGILLFLLFLLVFKARYIPVGNQNFFDQQNSKAMRGFWCLIVVLVHIPQAYQNSIQDMIGSFAYIGVTFFFMTSAYGLSLSAYKKPDSLKHFWLHRLPKLLIPNWIINILFAVIFFVFWTQKTDLVSCFAINAWVTWLLACYAAFWLGHVVNRNKKYSVVIVISLVIFLSCAVYGLKHIGMVYSTTWCPEVIGFVWGTVLFLHFDKVKRFFHQKWFLKATVFCLSSLILGILYLLYKNSIFVGDYLLKIVLGLVILCFILILNSKIQIGNKLSWFLGDISFEVYLVHGAVFSLIEQLLPNIGSGLFVLASILVSIVTAAIVHKLSNIVLHYCMPFISKRLSR